MNPKYITSLEVSKRMKEAGWQKETEFWWNYYELEVSGNKFNFHQLGQMGREGVSVSGNITKHVEYPAPLSDEILEELPQCFESTLGYSTFTIEKLGTMYLVGYELRSDPNEMPLYKMADTLPDALGELWISMQKIKGETKK